MKAIETTAIFDENGQLFITNLPQLKNQRVKLLILIDEEGPGSGFHTLSMEGLSRGYSTEEPDYDLGLIKEPNPLYKNAGK